MTRIPRIIHYCWFGRNPLPELAIKCIESWKKYLPDYEIKEWNEDNFDVNIIPYTAQAYQAKKYAFVSDYARFWVLYKYGGLYFDTDVEVIKSLDDVIAKGPFMGAEKPYIPSKEGAMTLGVVPGLGLGCNPGLGLGCNPGLGLIKEILEAYSKFYFINPDGSLHTKTIVDYTTEILCMHGLKYAPGIQKCGEFWIYPNDYFAPKDVDTKVLSITKNTRSIHHYDASWAEWYDRAAGERGPKLKRMLGGKMGGIFNNVIYAIQRFGIIGCLKKLFR